MFDFYLSVVGISWLQIQKALVMSDHLRKSLMKWETKLWSEHEICFTHLLSWHLMAEIFPRAQLLCFFSKSSNADTPLNSTNSCCSTFACKKHWTFEIWCFYFSSQYNMFGLCQIISPHQSIIHPFIFYNFCSKQNANLKYGGRFSGPDRIKHV